ncbi:MAG: universal stress protein [Deltaproteobacteria bacterium]
MKKVRKKINTLFNAVTFAEAGEHETAKEFLREPSKPAASQGVVRASTKSVKRTPGRNLRKAFEHYAAATAFGESGESKTAVEISRTPRHVTTVLLAVDGSDLDTDALRFATNLCTRMDASLDVLQVIHKLPPESGESLESLRAKYAEEMRNHMAEAGMHGMSTHISVSVGDVDKEVYAYAKNHKEVVAVVVDSPHTRDEKLERGKWTRILQRLSRRLAVPMITAESKAPVGAH